MTEAVRDRSGRCNLSFRHQPTVAGTSIAGSRPYRRDRENSHLIDAEEMAFLRLAVESHSPINPADYGTGEKVRVEAGA